MINSISSMFGWYYFPCKKSVAVYVCERSSSGKQLRIFYTSPHFNFKDFYIRHLGLDRGFQTKFPVSLYSLFFQNYQTTGYPLNITFIFHRCRHSLEAGACHMNAIQSNRYFPRQKISLTEKLMTGGLIIFTFDLPLAIGTRLAQR